MKRRPIRVAACCLSLLSLLAVSTAASAASGEAVLRPGEKLTPGQYLITTGAKATMQADGNFVIKARSNGAICSSTRTGGQGDSRSYITMQADGNLVLYKYSHGPALWASHTTTTYAGGIATLFSFPGPIGQTGIRISKSGQPNKNVLTCTTP